MQCYLIKCPREKIVLIKRLDFLWIIKRRPLYIDRPSDPFALLQILSSVLRPRASLSFLRFALLCSYVG